MPTYAVCGGNVRPSGNIRGEYVQGGMSFSLQQHNYTATRTRRPHQHTTQSMKPTLPLNQ